MMIHEDLSDQKLESLEYLQQELKLLTGNTENIEDLLLKDEIYELVNEVKNKDKEYENIRGSYEADVVDQVMDAGLVAFEEGFYEVQITEIGREYLEIANELPEAYRKADYDSKNSNDEPVEGRSDSKAEKIGKKHWISEAETREEFERYENGGMKNFFQYIESDEEREWEEIPKKEKIDWNRLPETPDNPEKPNWIITTEEMHENYSRINDWIIR